MWVTTEDEAKAIAEIERGPDRSLAILGLAMIDSRLSDILRKELHRDDTPYSAKIRSTMFNPEGALGAFGTKANLAYLMGFLTEEGLTDLKTMTGIRNDFGHYAEHTTFASESMTARCNNLKLINSRSGPPEHMITDKNGVEGWGEYWERRHGQPGVFIRLMYHKEMMADPKGRFVATTKLVLCALSMFQWNEIQKPVL